MKNIRLAYIGKTTKITDRIFHAWVAVFIFRFWSMWINQMEKKDLDLILSRFSDFNITSKKQKIKAKRQYFITYQSYISVEINAHSLVHLAVLVSEGQLPPEALNPCLQNSQTCESTFRSARSISSMSSVGVNFTVSQFLARISKLSILQHIKSNTSQNNLRFPRHHKLSATTRNPSTSSNTIIPSKNHVENSILNAYKYVTNLFIPLKIKQLLRKGLMIPIEELSRTISRQLEMSWTVSIDDSDNKYSDSESDDEANDNVINEFIVDYDDNEGIELNDDLHSIHNVSISANRRMRLVDNVNEELSDAYFQVIINNETKYLHKQAACWLLEHDKSSVSARSIIASSKSIKICIFNSFM